jgi:hypothetical protein
LHFLCRKTDKHKDPLSFNFPKRESGRKSRLNGGLNGEKGIEKGELKKQASQISKNLARCKQIPGRSKILVEDVHSLTILSIENYSSNAARRRQAKTKSP